jgi:hypothetical protein
MNSRRGRSMMLGMNNRHITYAPGSISRAEHVGGVPHPIWILCRNLTQVEIADDRALQTLADRGHIRKNDFLVSRSGEICIRASEHPALRTVFHDLAIRRFKRLCPFLSRAIDALCGKAADR